MLQIENEHCIIYLRGAYNELMTYRQCGFTLQN